MKVAGAFGLVVSGLSTLRVGDEPARGPVRAELGHFISCAGGEGRFGPPNSAVGGLLGFWDMRMRVSVFGIWFVSQISIFRRNWLIRLGFRGRWEEIPQTQELVYGALARHLPVLLVAGEEFHAIRSHEGFGEPLFVGLGVRQGVDQLFQGGGLGEPTAVERAIGADHGDDEIHFHPVAGLEKLDVCLEGLLVALGVFHLEGLQGCAHSMFERVPGRTLLSVIGLGPVGLGPVYL